MANTVVDIILAIILGKHEMKLENLKEVLLSDSFRCKSISYTARLVALMLSVICTVKPRFSSNKVAIFHLQVWV